MVQRKKPVTSRGGAKVRHQVRIIGGQWKRSVLPVAPVPELRPTPDRVRETLFNWLTHLSGNVWASLYCLDLFAGTGALGFEAASRGAGEVTLVEMNAQACTQLEAVCQKLKADKVNVLRQNAYQFVQNQARIQPQYYDIIFLDPPFESQALSEVLPWCAKLIKPTGWVYVEMRQSRQEGGFLDTLVEDATWKIVREDRAGQVRYALLQLN